MATMAEVAVGLVRILTDEELISQRASKGVFEEYLKLPH
jgi:hypothetical protein